MPYFSLSKGTNPSRFVNLLSVLFICFSFNAEKVQIVVEKQIHMHLNSIDPKIKIFCDFRVFVLSPIPKNENSEITEILQKHHNTEI